MRWSAAWQDEPPLLMQIRNLLAHLVSANYTQMGAKCEPSDFIPRRTQPVDELEQQRAMMEMWAIRHNAQVD